MFKILSGLTTACAVAALTFSAATLSQDDESAIDEWQRKQLADICIDGTGIPDFISKNEWLQNSELICKQLEEEKDDFAAAPEGMEVWNANPDDTEEVENALKDSAERDGLSFDSLFSREPEPVEETRTDFGFRERLPDYDERDSQQQSEPAPSYDRRRHPPREALASAQATTRGGPVELGDIHGARQQVKVQEAKQSLFGKNQQIASQCQCSFSGSSCLKAERFKHQKLNQSMDQADANFEQKIQQVCSGWRDNLRGKTADNLDALTLLASDSDTVLRNLDTLQHGYEDVVGSLQASAEKIDKEIRIAKARRAAAEKKKNSGPSLGALAFAGAMGLGIASSGIPMDKAAGLIANMTSDILAESSGGQGGATAGYMKQHGYGAPKLEKPAYRSGSSASRGSAASPAPRPPDVAAGMESAMNQAVNAPGHYGAIIYGSSTTDFSTVGIATSRSSRDTALLAAQKNCGAACSSQSVLHEWIDPGECVALAYGAIRSPRVARRVFKGRASSASSAQTNALDQCRSKAGVLRDSGVAMSCSIRISGCNR